MGHEITGNGLPHPVNKFGLFAGTLGADIDGLGPVAQGVEAALEADAFQRDVMEMRGLLHESAHEVVGDQMDVEFLLDHGRALAAQDIEAEGGLDLGEVEFDVPTLRVEFADGVGGIEHGIDERGGDEHGAGAEPLCGDHRADEAHGQLLRQTRELVLAPDFGTVLRLGPDDQAVPEVQTTPEPKIAFAQLVQAHHRVDSPVMQRCPRSVGAKGAVGQDDVSLFELGPELAKEGAVVGVCPPDDMFQERPAGQGKEPCHLHHREPATRLLPVGLRPDRLIFGRVRHGDPGAVDDLDLTPSNHLSFLRT